MIYGIEMILMIGGLNYHYKKGNESGHVIINHGLKECGLKIHTSSLQLLVHIMRSWRSKVYGSRFKGLHPLEGLGMGSAGDILMEANHRCAVKRWKISNLYQRCATFGAYPEEQGRELGISYGARLVDV